MTIGEIYRIPLLFNGKVEKDSIISPIYKGGIYTIYYEKDNKIEDKANCRTSFTMYNKEYFEKWYSRIKQDTIKGKFTCGNTTYSIKLKEIKKSIDLIDFYNKIIFAFLESIDLGEYFDTKQVECLLSFHANYKCIFNEMTILTRVQDIIDKIIESEAK